MTCDICFKDGRTQLLKRLDDPEQIWYCSSCSQESNKRILNLKNGVKKTTALIKRENG
jgi:ribosomal protein L37AE/L43A